MFPLEVIFFCFCLLSFLGVFPCFVFSSVVCVSPARFALFSPRSCARKKKHPRRNLFCVASPAPRPSAVLPLLGARSRH
ncbi:uncharacterized protein ASCRUDRAFT_78129 [Ascoidea rubescens DSM 1968]|uniref:Uncharacterized protein n=1 Tax=Ascoidea rubescens DSM 1968 TaxID=1344418 RepID=A0A1D2V9L4_9ASCO|nr:hypothetical protein ASCRUDRAFT_78129 [Ascoidea rubescens DSM 1968]ODV58225.1 hypothetical protein ASCRUDRAFT_78129 [Ascoidea rubescens DSM 1968]